MDYTFMVKDAHGESSVVNSIDELKRMYDFEQYYIQLNNTTVSERGLYNVAEYDTHQDMVEYLHSGEKYVNVSVDPEEHDGEDTLEVEVIDLEGELKKLKLGCTLEIAVFNEDTGQDEYVEITRSYRVE